VTAPASPVQPLSKWLQLMLAEIARKREALEQARAEQLWRAAEAETTKRQEAATHPRRVAVAEERDEK
jgi:septal ring factor EnvC (AmiA/AmiB activator)